ncbi:MAG: LptF/LptG family permease [Bacteroidota bacterium]|nr:LptF/LptG family permease [Bacteroidota bacterium]
MKRLHTFILKSYIGPLVLTFFISLFILLMQFLWKYIDDLAGKGLEWTVILELIVYASARLVPMALPLAILLSSIMTFGNFGENFELTAIKSAGISLQKFMAPLIYLIIIISIGAFFYSNHIIPYTNLKTVALIYDVKNKNPELQLKAGMFYNGIDGYSIKIGQKNHKTNLLEEIMIYDHTNNKENIQVTVADSGYMRMTADERNLILTLYNGYSYEEVEENKRRKKEKVYPHQRHKFEKQTVIIDLSGLNFERSDEDLWKNNFQMLSLNQLEFAEDSLNNQFNEQIMNFKNRLIRSDYFKNQHLLEKDIKRIRSTERNFKNDYPSKEIVKPQKTKVNKDIAQTQIRKDSFTSNIKQTKKKDTAAQKISTFVPDSILKNLPIEQKREAIAKSLTYARSTQNQITNNKKQFDYKGELIRRHQIEWHRKFTLSFACLVFFFIGAPFGAIIRKGGFGTPVVASILLFILYYMLSIAGEKFVRQGVLPAYIGMWLSSFILGPLGIFLTYKATTDSVILSTEAYSTFFKKIFLRFTKKNA